MSDRCTVCETDLEHEPARVFVTDDEERLYFCSDLCERRFHEDPETFLYPEEAAKERSAR